MFGYHFLAHLFLLGLAPGVFGDDAVPAWPMVGWDAYRSYDMARFRPGEVTRQFSSYDRKGANDDGFNGTYSCLRMDEAGRCVIAEADGPGEVDSIWFTYESDSVIPIGDIRIELDATPVLEGNLQEIVNSGRGPPFVWPLVGNTNDTAGGNVIKVPMPYQKTMLITTQNNPHFYHVTYRTFPANIQVATFDPKEDISDVIGAFRGFGIRDPKLSNSNSKDAAHTNHKTIQVPAQGSQEVALAQSCGTITQLQLRIPEILSAPNLVDDGRAFGKGGSSNMTLLLDQSNSECRLTRRVDASIGNQVITVSIDGKPAGNLTTGEAQDGTFLDQVLNIDPSLTKGKSSISVTSQFASSDVDANEFMYALHCKTSDAWALPAYGPSTNWTLMDVLNVGPNNPHDEAAHSYSIVGKTWEGLRNYTYQGARLEQAAVSTQLLSAMTISLTFDGKTTIDQVPLGSFFGTSLAKTSSRTLLLSVDATQPDGAFTAYFPMPVAGNATLTIRNTSPATVNPTVDWAVDTESCPPEDQSTWGYFSTQHRRDQTTEGQVWPILSTKGPGISYGHTHTFRGSIMPPDNELQFLEGDEQVYVNRTTPPEDPINDPSTTMLGTGTEDFYESGWYFADANGGDIGKVGVPYDMPLVGVAGHLRQQSSLGCVGECLDVRRLMVADSSAFGAPGISFNIEHGDVGNNIQANYETCAFYYA